MRRAPDAFCRQQTYSFPRVFNARKGGQCTPRGAHACRSRRVLSPTRGSGPHSSREIGTALARPLIMRQVESRGSRIITEPAAAAHLNTADRSIWWRGNARRNARRRSVLSAGKSHGGLVATMAVGFENINELWRINDYIWDSSRENEDRLSWMKKDFHVVYEEFEL